MAERDDKSLLRKILPRVLKAAFWGFLMGGETLLFSSLPMFREIPFLPSGYEPFFYGSMAVFVSFEVAIQLSSGTILQYALGAARALAVMMMLIFLSDGGVMTMTIPIEAVTLQLVLDFSVFLAMFLLISLLGIAKNVLQAICFLSERVEQLPP